MAIEEFFDISTKKDCSGYYTMANQILKRYSIEENRNSASFDNVAISTES